MGEKRERVKPSVTADCIVLTRDGEGGPLRVLLIRRARDPFAGRWALPGGFVNPDETLSDAAARELLEETGVEATGLRQVGAYGDPGRDPRGWVISVAYVVIVDSAPGGVRGTDDASEAGWFSVDDLPPLAFDHARIMKDALAEIGVAGSNLKEV